MFRILRIHDHVLPIERDRVARVQEILRAQFPGVAPKDVAKIPEQLQNPHAFGFRTTLFVAEGYARVRGFAILLSFPEARFAFLDFISAARPGAGGGVGGALYEAVREAAKDQGADGLYFECLPDDPALCRDPATLRQNAARLRFYERFGARPITGTAYETPLVEGGDNPPYLVYDGLGRDAPLRRDRLREVIGTFLRAKYAELCGPAYVAMVLDSIRDDPVRLREPRLRRAPAAAPVRHVPALDRAIALVVTDRHEIHHVRDRGYVEAPVRIEHILKEIEPTGLFRRVAPRDFPERHLRAVHDADFVTYLKRMCRNVPEGRSVYPYVFPIRNAARPPRDLPIRAGYYCIDTFTPLNRSAWEAARRAADCALTAAATLLDGGRLAYALVRPPGHHAERRAFGGFCYLNNAAIAANFLSAQGRVAVLDIDYHHGNGTQSVFYGRSDVLTVSIHGHPRFAYPYFSGFSDERGEGEGRGFNLNLPLPEDLSPAQYQGALRKAVARVVAFRPRFLVVALGLDTAKGDPTGTWSLRAPDFEAAGRQVGEAGLRTLVVQEGGYRVRTLGVNARHFFQGLWAGAAGVPAVSGPGKGPAAAPRR